MADVVRAHAGAFRLACAAHGVPLLHEQQQALTDIIGCRTAAMGGHRELYTCGHEVTAYNSCRNRNCPQCQQHKARAWTAAKERDLLPVPYFHVVFTLPPALANVPHMARVAVYEALFRAASSTLLQFGHNNLGGQLGFTAVLHTWGQTLTHHPHLHCVVAGGAYNVDADRWTPSKESFLFPVRALSLVFRGKMLADLARRGLPGLDATTLAALLKEAGRPKWVVYAKRPFGGPQQVLRYLARYTHKVAIGDYRIVDVDDDDVAFSYKDYRDDVDKVMRLSGVEWLRRFCDHVLPRHFTRLRTFGFLANTGKRDNLAAIRSLLKAESPVVVVAEPRACPCCGVGVLVHRELLEPFSLLPRRDSS